MIIRPPSQKRIELLNHRVDRFILLMTFGSFSNSVIEGFQRFSCNGPPTFPKVKPQKIKPFLKRDHPGFLFIQLQLQPCEHGSGMVQRLRRFFLASTEDQQASNAEELPLYVLSEPGVNLSAHRAPIIQPPV
jgi:hypothetical protein